ncbi:hypothetical protein M9Y10_014816 [Tritrichomonas musculus]|uniref:BZIP domain-containing protein n=1 Tax=Tritrichomonas musculus TaxID=1915356 RepID=A0ABR2L0J2_9EUKA
MTEINVTEFIETPVIKKLKEKQTKPEYEEERAESPELREVIEVKCTRGRKRKYNTEEERIQARRLQQKAYRERKKKELEELRTKVNCLSNAEAH